MRVVHSRAEFAAARAGLSAPVGLVPTMGALHGGHVALLEQARAECASVVTTNFVNPMQFEAQDDLARYPRTLETDLAVCEKSGVDVVWAPGDSDVYPYGGSTRVRVEPGRSGELLEGQFRPGHFAGVLTVVAKFLNVVRPDRAYFGEKDYQQLTLIRQLVEDLDVGPAIVGVATVREPDGLALSSRNVHLSSDERRQAVALSRALFAGRDAAAAGARAVIASATAALALESAVQVEYLELRGVDLGEPPEHGPARLLIAARVGRTRLIDNTEVLL